jgi:hypothetical protein
MAILSFFEVFPCHCERSEAIHLSAYLAMDCFAALAMTDKTKTAEKSPPL